jgi:hypothetical protein
MDPLERSGYSCKENTDNIIEQKYLWKLVWSSAGKAKIAELYEY